MRSERVFYVALPSGTLRWVPTYRAGLMLIASYPDNEQLQMDLVSFQPESYELNRDGELEVPF